ncbi:MAG: CPBP family intramembrane metalloprotease [Actinobacteria bacterium]|nr:CPBP family intramembrane metalloprotease [Actinomycetota bacterium]
MRAALLLGGFVLAVALRVVVGGADAGRSARAGLLFAGFLLWGAAAVRTPVPVTRRGLVYGIAGALALCVPVLLTWTPRRVPPDGFALWALVVSVVAVAEEVFLRGALYDAVRSRAGDNAAIALGALAFGLLHLPLYGLSAVPLP